ncbi:MAG: branched-chain amino acid ABC transporter permease [Stellaceae bacterium]
MISPALLLIQTLNGVQFGMMLFLFAAGLTLVLGIMNLINLAHGSIYMVGAFFAATFAAWTGSFILGLLLALPATFAVAVVIEFVVLRALYERGHLDQVLATFGLILLLNELVRIIWGSSGLYVAMPSFLVGDVMLLPGVIYPIYRLAITGVGLVVALGLYLVIAHTRLGMLIRAGASNREMVEAIGVDVRLLFTMVFGLGAMLAAFAGGLAGPLISVDTGMGDSVLILALVVIVIGGIGSIRGSFIAALVIGLVDTLGRAFLPGLFAMFLSPPFADAIGPAVGSMLIYILMAVVLFFRPQGLLPARSG